MLPINIKYVVSLGCDVIVKTDLAKLIDTIPDDVSLIGARGPLKSIDNIRNSKSKSGKNYIKYWESHLNLNLENMVNSEVLIYNLDKMRLNKSMPDAALNYLHSHLNLRNLDEEIINVIFKDDIYHIDQRYNIWVRDLKYYEDSLINEDGTYKPLNDCILHFGGTKPWDLYLNKIDLEYWHYVLLTPWNNNNEEWQNYNLIVRSPEDVINHIDDYICRYLRRYQIKSAYKLTIPLYIKLLKRYLILKKELRSLGFLGHY